MEIFDVRQLFLAVDAPVFCPASPATQYGKVYVVILQVAQDLETVE